MSYSHTTRLMREKFKAKFAKPYPHDYRRSPYYKQSFYLKMYNILKKFKLKYDIKTGNIINLETNEPFLIFSFDETSQQLSANNVKVWSLTKPRMAKNTEKVKSNAAGFYSLTHEGKDYLKYLENSKAVTIAESFKDLRELNPHGVILLFIDNFPSHIAHVVKNLAKELNIELLYLPTYSPQLQPEEKVWYSAKRFLSQLKIDVITSLKKLSKNESEEILKNNLEKSFYTETKSKKRWNKVLNNYIKPIIKLLNPIDNENLKIQKNS
jgi:transposase